MIIGSNIKKNKNDHTINTQFGVYIISVLWVMDALSKLSYVKGWIYLSEFGIAYELESTLMIDIFYILEESYRTYVPDWEKVKANV